jgi:mannose-1-phosphate guanylyltransferase
MLKLSCKSISHEKSYAQLTANAPSNCVALLLAGGDGTRLQELTREITGTPIPKQYCKLWYGSSLLESTLTRAHLFAPRNRISVIVNEDHLHLARGQLSSLSESNILVQPLNRDTGPGILFSLLNLERKHPNAIVAAFPTDHFIDDDRAFVAHALRAVNIVTRMPDKIAMLGVAPDRPETGYGYILPADRLVSSEKAFYVEAFTEKPSLINAKEIIARGGLWNTFVMVFKISRMLELVRSLVPHHFERLSTLRSFPEKSAEIYQDLEPWNLSIQVLSKIPEHLVMLEVADVLWSDWGTRESVERTCKTLNIAPFWSLSNSVTNSIPG